MTMFRTGAGGRSAVLRQALRNPPLRRVLAAYFVFNVAEWATWIALLVWGYGEGGVRGASAIGLVQLVPAALLASPAAAVIGRLPRGIALCAGYVAQAVTYAVVGVTLVSDAPVEVVGLAAVASAVTVSLTRPVHHALLPEISRTTGDLTAGNAASGSLEAIATFVGPLACSGLLVLWGPGGVLLSLGGITLVPAALTLGLTTTSQRRVATLDGSPHRPVRDVLGNPAARLMCALVAAEQVLVGMTDILLVVLALDVLAMSDAGPGILNSATGVGGILGAALTVLLIGRQHLALPLVLGAVGAGVAFAFAGTSTTPVLALVLVAASGAGKAFYDVTSRTFIQRLLPDHLLAAMFGLQEAMTMTGIAVGTLAAPALVAVVGPRLVFVLAGSFLPLVALASYARLRRLDAGAAVPVEVLTLLMRVPILSVLAPRIVERLARDASPENVPAGDAVVSTGEPGSLFYVIASGLVDVTIDDHEVRELGPGGWFGEIALLHDVPRTATVTALTDVSLWTLDRQSFLSSVTSMSTSLELAETHIRDTYL
jgi:hypothetical protein